MNFPAHFACVAELICFPPEGVSSGFLIAHLLLFPHPARCSTPSGFVGAQVPSSLSTSPKRRRTYIQPDLTVQKAVEEHAVKDEGTIICGNFTGLFLVPANGDVAAPDRCCSPVSKAPETDASRNFQRRRVANIWP